MTVQVSARAPHQIGRPALTGVHLHSRAALYRGLAILAAVLVLGVCAGDRAGVSTAGSPAPASGVQASAPLIP